MYMIYYISDKHGFVIFDSPGTSSSNEINILIKDIYMFSPKLR